MKNTYQTLIHYDFTDELHEFLNSRGHTVYCIYYGYYNQLDLIVWGE